MKYENDEVSTFHILYEDEDIQLVVESAPSFMEGVFVHTQVKHFSKNRYKKFQKKWMEVIEYLNSCDIYKIYALPPDEVAKKWQVMFGFVDTGVTYEGQVIMKYEESTWEV